MTLASRTIALAFKRFFDISVAAAALIILSPLIGLIALAIKLDDGGSIFFIQDRVGRGRKNFRCYKFRTMIVGAEEIGNKLTVTADDDRITRVGRLLRNWTLDEIPQLFNVLKGDMSIVGPRPWVPSQAAYCSVEDSRRFNFKPGMAGLAWINGRNRLPWDERVRLDLWYVDHWSSSLDFSILARAFVLLFRRDGVYFQESAEQGARSMEQEANRGGDQQAEIGEHLITKSSEHGAGNGDQRSENRDQLQQRARSMEQGTEISDRRTEISCSKEHGAWSGERRTFDGREHRAESGKLSARETQRLGDD